MTDKDYKQNIERLKQIEALVKDPESSLDNIDKLLDETKKIVRECYAYTRGLRDKVGSLTSL